MKHFYQLFTAISFLICPFLLQAQLSPITQITLTFTPNSGTPITATATDPNGNGLVVDNDITLGESTEYRLEISLRNIGGNININDEINANKERYQFFFETPGSIVAGDVKYNDEDGNGLPLGLDTKLTSECVESEGSTGSLRIVLNDLMNEKTVNSSLTDGTALFDLTWSLSVTDDPSAPPCENEEEIITDVILTWTPKTGGETATARAQDPDGEGPQDLQILGAIELIENTEYTLSISVRNEIEGEDITEEIQDEDDEHLFFFSFSEGIFSNPSGDGNLDNRTDPLNYNDQDENGLPVGLSTDWTTTTDMNSGTFRIVLKHQPGSKSANSTSNDGGTDIDLSWPINTVLTKVDDPWTRAGVQLHLSPNPVRDQMQWRLENLPSKDFGVFEVRIFDTVGHLILRKTLRDNFIDLNQLSNGTYLFQLRQGPQFINKRFVKVD